MVLLMLLVGGVIAAIVSAVVEQTRFNGRRQRTSAAIATANVPLTPTPIKPTWLLDDDDPVTEAVELARSDDGSTCVYLWQTTRARYTWEHQSDEVVTVLDGEVFLADMLDAAGTAGPERRLGAGDVAFFPAGSRTLWRVPDRLRKVSTLTRPVPGPAASALRWARALKRGADRMRQPEPPHRDRADPRATRVSTRIGQSSL